MSLTVQGEAPEEGAEGVAEAAILQVSGESLAEQLHCSLPCQLRAAIVWGEGEGEGERGRGGEGEGEGERGEGERERERGRGGRGGRGEEGSQGGDRRCG